jgi:class 3 adenylate cyclase
MPAMAHHGESRTLMAAVAFADLVGYSKKPMADQFAAKDSFRELLQRVLVPVDADSRIMLDTGDGAAIAFLADPEHALYFALKLREELSASGEGGLLRPGDLRLGLNLGPVKRMVDLNGRANLVGEGMNTAERVMSFASPGETMASRSFCDAISCLRESYRHLFVPLGLRADKHGREHEVFRVSGTGATLAAAGSSLGASDPPGPVETAAPPEIDAPPADKGGHRQRVPMSRRWVAAALLAVAGGTGVSWLLAPSRPPDSLPLASPAPAARPAPDVNVPIPAPLTAGVRELDVSPGAPSPDARGDPSPASRAPEPLRPAERLPSPSPARHQGPGPLDKRAADGSPRCSALVQRAALGETLGPKDQEELRTSCR